MSIRDTTDNDSDWEDSGDDDDDDSDDDTSSVQTSMSSSSVVGVPDTSARQPLFSAASASTADKKTCDPVKVQEELKAFFGKRDPRTFICQPGNKYRLILTEPSARATAIFKAIGSDLSRWNIETLRRLLVDGFNVYLPPGYLQSHQGVLNHMKQLYSKLEAETTAYEHEIDEDNRRLITYYDNNIKDPQLKAAEAALDARIARDNATAENSYQAEMKAWRAERKRISDALKAVQNPGDLARFAIPDQPKKPPKQPARNKRSTVYQFVLPIVRGEYIPTQEFARRRHPRRLINTAFSGLSLLAILTALYKIK